jgi:hypothetical protein
MCTTHRSQTNLTFNAGQKVRVELGDGNSDTKKLVAAIT